MLGTFPPTNWSQIFKEIPLLLVIMSHRKWDGGEGGREEKGGESQTSVISLIILNTSFSSNLFCISPISPPLSLLPLICSNICQVPSFSKPILIENGILILSSPNSSYLQNITMISMTMNSSLSFALSKLGNIIYMVFPSLSKYLLTTRI